ncbi:hypothetical protein KY345_01045 [Candidatus Woesearchaeota archaeon]|nr:hypothetical protein [Candidatus Woesearchaeota archaeon]
MREAVIKLVEDRGINRLNEPVTTGIPIKKGLVFDIRDVCLFDNKEIPCQKKILARWNDGSVKWMLVDFMASVKAKGKKILYLKSKKTKRKSKEIFIDNLDRFVRNIKIEAIDNKGKVYYADFSRAAVEDRGELKVILRYDGKIRRKNKVLFDFTARFSFYNEGRLIKLDFTVKNPRAAEHRDGFWDLGDTGSVLFKDLSIKLSFNDGFDVYYKDRTKSKFKKCGDVFVYSDSSRNKVQPSVLLRNDNFSISAAVKDFWQNFPKSIRADKNGIVIGLFPKQDGLHELQGGEQKTHMMYFDLDRNDLSWVNEKLNVVLEPSYVCSTGVIPYLTSNPDKRYQDLIDCAIKGKYSFENKNKEIDEFGWRNFGDVYADHEAVHEREVSHYNNQYDLINGALVQFFRSGDAKWFRIADNMAKHVHDTDIYHTRKDISAYNGGLFWHTFHYVDAFTSTHRSYSRLGASKMGKYGYGVGGGPSNEHNYATGLMNHYFLTGEEMSKEGVLGLADWVINMDDGRKSRLWFLGNKATGKASQSGSIYYHGPGRGSGNSINVLMDGFEISGNKRYLLKCEELIRRCIHPKDDISKNNIEDVEHRWFYLVFLQALGRYLDLKIELEQTDYMFYYAKESLLHYAGWMIKNEVPYKEVLHRVEIPSETWPAQDIRKSVVFDFAYKYSGDSVFKERSEYFFNRCIDDLSSFSTKKFTRPLAILMHYSAMHDYFRQNDVKMRFNEKRFNFGKPKRFKPQGYYLYKIRDIIKRK